MDRRLLSALFGPGGRLSHEADLADADLLARFAASRAPGETGAVESGIDGAFSEIVRRHGPLVWAVCRGSLADPADAEDAFQATFLALVRSPRAVRRGGSLPGWLHGVAVRVTAGLKRTAGRRKRREARAAVPEGHSPVPDSAWGDVYAAVQAEVARLPAGLKAAFVLCEIGRVPHAEAAQQLGWKPGTLTGTLARAKRRLIARLAERGIAPAALAGVGAASGSAAAVPWKLIEAVNVFPGAAAGTVPVALVQLATEGLVMGVSHMKLLAAAAVIAGGLTVGVGPALLPSADAQAPDGGFGRGGGVGLPAGVKPTEPAASKPARVIRTDPMWNYQFEDRPADNAAFVRLVETMGKNGWEYAGPTVTKDPGDSGTKLVFKRSVRVFDVSELVVPPTPADLPPRAGGAPPGGLLGAAAAPAGTPSQKSRADLAALKAELERLGRDPNVTGPMQAYLRALAVTLENLAAGATVPPGVTPPAASVDSAPQVRVWPTAQDPGAVTFAMMRAELIKSEAAVARLTAQLDQAAKMADAARAKQGTDAKPVAGSGIPLGGLGLRPAPDPKPAVFDVDANGLASMEDIVSVVEAGLDRDSAKVAGTVRVAAFGQQLVIFGGTPQTAERVVQLTATLGVKLTPAKAPTPPSPSK